MQEHFFIKVNIFFIMTFFKDVLKKKKKTLPEMQRVLQPGFKPVPRGFILGTWEMLTSRCVWTLRTLLPISYH